mmetsp:Transcript_47971/g.133771  ORF Transcript_47971/g.133771 Transcript_47971/m.133771 type:complete len:377 (+) Transcript_47971:372-1502(+)
MPMYWPEPAPHPSPRTSTYVPCSRGCNVWCMALPGSADETLLPVTRGARRRSARLPPPPACAAAKLATAAGENVDSELGARHAREAESTVAVRASAGAGESATFVTASAAPSVERLRCARANSSHLASGIGPSARPCVRQRSPTKCCRQNSELSARPLEHRPPRPLFHVRATHRPSHAAPGVGASDAAPALAAANWRAPRRNVPRTFHAKETRREKAERSFGRTADAAELGAAAFDSGPSRVATSSAAAPIQAPAMASTLYGCVKVSEHSGCSCVVFVASRTSLRSLCKSLPFGNHRMPKSQVSSAEPRRPKRCKHSARLHAAFTFHGCNNNAFAASRSPALQFFSCLCAMDRRSQNAAWRGRCEMASPYAATAPP